MLSWQVWKIRGQNHLLIILYIYICVSISSISMKHNEDIKTTMIFLFWNIWLGILKKMLEPELSPIVLIYFISFVFIYESSWCNKTLIMFSQGLCCWLGSSHLGYLLAIDPSWFENQFHSTICSSSTIHYSLLWKPI